MALFWVAGTPKSPAVSSCAVTSSPTAGVELSGNGPLVYVNVAVGARCAIPTPPNTYGAKRLLVGISNRSPPSPYVAGTRPEPTTVRPDPETIAVVVSMAGCTCDGCRLRNWPRLPNTNRCGATRTPASPSQSPDVVSGLTANPPAPVTNPRADWANDGAAARTMMAVTVMTRDRMTLPP